MSPELITKLEFLLDSPEMHTVSATLLALGKVKTLTPHAQLRIANLVAVSSTASRAVDIMENLKWVTSDAYTIIAGLSRANAEAGAKISFTEDPERLLKRIQPIEGAVTVGGSDIQAAIAARKQIEEFEARQEVQDQKRRIEENMAEQRRTNPQVRTGETDISESERRRNLADLQSQASSLFLRGSYLQAKANMFIRFRVTVQQPEPLGSYSGVFTTTTGAATRHEGKQAIPMETVVEYDLDFHHRFNMATMRSTNYVAYENGQSLHFISRGEKPGWEVSEKEPEEHKSVRTAVGDSHWTKTWKYIGDFTAPNGIRYKKCFRLTTVDAEGKEISHSIFTPGLGGVYTKTTGSESMLEAYYPKR